MVRRRLAAVVCLAVVAGVAVAACSSSSGSTRAGGASCGPILRETLDQRSLQHVLPGNPVPSYLTNPPT